MKTFFLFALLILSGCGTASHIDPEFQSYVDLFRSEAKSRGRHLASSSVGIEFGEALEQGKCGECQMNRQVKIDKACWDQLGDGPREALIFHELGHCLLDRGHVTETMPTTQDPIPYSLMDPSAALLYYSAWRDHYLDELFGNGKTDRGRL